MRFGAPALLFLLILVAIGMSLSLYGKSFRGYDARVVIITNEKGDENQAVLYIPRKAAKAKYPAMLSIHYGLQNREALQPMASTMAENGIIVLEMVLSRSGKNGRAKNFVDYISDVKAGADYLLAFDKVDPDRVYLSGHSIGANLASIVAASNPGVAGIIAIGYPIEFPKNCRKRMLMASGIFDELHQPTKMLEAFRETLPEGAPEKVLFSYEKIPDAVSGESAPRIYLFSQLSDHYLEPTDPNLTRGAITFINSIGGKPEKVSPIPFRLKILARPFLFMGIFFLFAFALIHLDRLKIENAPSWLAKRCGVILFVTCYIIMGAVFRPGEELFSAVFLGALLAALIATNFFAMKAQGRNLDETEASEEAFARFQRDSEKVLFFVLIFFVSFALGLCFHCGIYAWSGWERAADTFLGIVYLMFGSVYVFFSRINGLFLRPDWTINLLSPVVWGIVTAEIVFPGGIGKVLDEFFSRIIGAAQNLDFRIQWNVSPQSLGLLAVVILAAAMSWRHILAEGYAISSKEILGMGYLFFCFILLPFGACCLILRREFVKKMLDRLSFKKG